MRVMNIKNGGTLRRVRRRRAAMLLFYMLVAFPMLVVCGILSIEYQRMLTSNRVSYQVADAAAAAGTLALAPMDSTTQAEYNALGCTDPDLWSMCLYDGSKGVTLNGVESVQDVVAGTNGAYTGALSNREGAKLVLLQSTEVVSIRQASRAGGVLTPAEVVVRVRYKVPSMGFLALGRLIGASVDTNTVYEVRGRSYVCSPGEGETARGECVR